MALTPEQYLAAHLTRASSADLGELAASGEFRLNLYQALGTKPTMLGQYQPLLRDLFERELRYRLSDDEDEDTYFENIYFCGLLLYEVGLLGDLELLCRAKFCRDMDLGMGFDIQFLLGAGLEPTLSYLSQHPMAWCATALSYLKRCHEAGDLDWLDEWHRAKRAYFGLVPG